MNCTLRDVTLIPSMTGAVSLSVSAMSALDIAGSASRSNSLSCRRQWCGHWSGTQRTTGLNRVIKVKEIPLITLKNTIQVFQTVCVLSVFSVFKKRHYPGHLLCSVSQPLHLSVLVVLAYGRLLLQRRLHFGLIVHFRELQLCRHQLGLLCLGREGAQPLFILK